MEKVHCMSLSSIHINYNHDPVQAQVCTQRSARARPALLAILFGPPSPHVAPEAERPAERTGSLLG